MARKKGNSAKLVCVIILVIILIAATGGGVLFFQSAGNRLSRLPTFPSTSYLGAENLWTLEDQEFKIEGRVDKVIMPSADRSTILVSIHPDGVDHRLPVLISKEAGKKSVRPEQDLILKIVIGDSFELRCTEYTTR